MERSGCRPNARLWAMHGHMADRIGVVPAVCRTACYLAMCLVPGVEGSFDLPVGGVTDFQQSPGRHAIAATW
jgi:hypothetical protein